MKQNKYIAFHGNIWFYILSSRALLKFSSINTHIWIDYILYIIYGYEGENRKQEALPNTS